MLIPQSAEFSGTRRLIPVSVPKTAVIPPRRIILSGGGIKIVSQVGALQILESRGLLQHVKEVGGVSAGAFLGLLLAAGVPLSTIRNVILDIDFSKIRNLTPDGIIGFPETFGLDDGTNLMKFLESITRIVLKQDPNMTFADFNKVCTINFRCWASDLVTYDSKEFSYAKTPSVRILDALRASMSLPFYYTPVKDTMTGNLLCDGGVHGCIPLYNLSEAECSESLAIGFCMPRGHVANVEISDLMSFSNALFSCAIVDRTRRLLNEMFERILEIPVDNFPSWNFEASREDRLMLIETGAKAAIDWLENGVSRYKSRRHSI